MHRELAQRGDADPMGPFEKHAFSDLFPKSFERPSEIQAWCFTDASASEAEAEAECEEETAVDGDVDDDVDDTVDEAASNEEYTRTKSCEQCC